MSVHTGVIVLAKAPVPGLAKTRVAADVGDQAAAEIAAACLLDTMDAVEGWVAPADRVIALTGDLALATRGGEIAQRLACWSVVDQRGSSLGQRIYRAHQDARSIWGSNRTVVQIGMDSPALTTAHLSDLAAPIAEGWTDAALGLAVDGGWWGMATSDDAQVASIVDVAMSRPDTGRSTLARLVGAGASVSLGPVLRDLDVFDDALAIAATIPHSHLAGVLVRMAALTS